MQRLFRLLRSKARCQDLQAKPASFSQRISKHRHLMSLYDLNPEVGAYSHIAPNATVVGEVSLALNCVVWYNAVIRGDMNAVRLMNYVIVGERTVIHTAVSLPNGMPASVLIGNNTVIQNDCTLYSCTIGDKCLVGYKSVILEGAKLEDGAALAPHTVVPPCRVIPANQLWAGNPAQYVKDLQASDLAQFEYLSYNQHLASIDHKYEYLPQNSAYLQKENTADDQNPDLVSAALRSENYEQDMVTL